MTNSIASVCCIPVPGIAPPPPVAHIRHGKPAIRYTYRTAAGEIAFHIDRYETAAGKIFAPLTLWQGPDGLIWQWKAPPAPRPLYGLDALAARPHAPVMICEGEKATDAARHLFPSTVVVSWPGGVGGIGKVDLSPLGGRTIWLWPDLDEPGQKAMTNLAARLRTLPVPPATLFMIEPAFFGLSAPGDDAADITGWDAARCEREMRMKVDWRTSLNPARSAARTVASGSDIQKQPGRGPDVPAGQPAAIPARSAADKRPPKKSGRFHLDEDGVHVDDDGVRHWICAPIEVIGQTRNSDSTDWGRCVRFKDSDGKLHRPVIQNKYFLGDGSKVLEILQNEGLRMAAGKLAKARVLEYLETGHPACRIRIASRTGWHEINGGRVFVLPEHTYGNMEDEEWIYSPDGERNNPFGVKGSLEEWTDAIGVQCRGNSRLLFAVSVAFGAPLLNISGLESGGFHFRGHSGDGKTTLLKVACSVAGGQDYMQQWRTTDNALESLALQYCDSLLAMDELGQVEGRIAGETTYMLANGSGKARATRTGDARIRAKWRTLYLSTGEISLSQHVTESGKPIRAGQEMRCVDIPADAGMGHGVWEDLHGCDHAAEFARHLNHAVRQFHGAPLRSFLEKLVNFQPEGYTDAAEYINSLLREERDAFAHRFLTEAASGQVRRVMDRFVLAAVGGELATEWGITGWQVGEARQGAQKCFQDWLDARGGEGEQETLTMIRQGKKYILQHLTDFMFWHRAHDDHAPRPVHFGGLVRWCLLDGTVIDKVEDKGEDFRHKECCQEFFVFPEMWREIFKGGNPDAAAKWMAEHEYLIHDKGRTTRNMRIPTFGRKRVYHIKSEFFGDDDEQTP
jgi:uncharacterized protein (DUF927 family)